LILKECRPGLVALSNVLKKFIQNFPDSVILTLWLTDVTKAAETVISAAGLQVCTIYLVGIIYQSTSTHCYYSNHLLAFWAGRPQAEMKNSSRPESQRKPRQGPRAEIAKENKR